jgi:hypothetical protein
MKSPCRIEWAEMTIGSPHPRDGLRAALTGRARWRAPRTTYDSPASVAGAGGEVDHGPWPKSSLTSLTRILLIAR